MVSTAGVARLAPLLLLAIGLTCGAAWLFGDFGAGTGARAHAVHAGWALSPEVVADTTELAGGPNAELGFSHESGRSAVAVEPLPDAAATEVVAPEPEAPEPAQLIGRVMRHDGKPCTDATVIVATGWAQSLPIELEDLGQASSWLKRVRTATDADGRFVVQEGLQLGGELVLYVAAPGAAPLRLDRPPPGARGAALPLDYGQLTLREGAVVRGRVVDRRGNAVPGARITLAVVHGEQGFGVDFPSRGVPLVATADDGAFVLDRLERGPFTLLIEAPGRTVCRMTGVASARPIDDFRVVLEPGSVIAGKVVGLEARATDAARPLRIEARPGKPDGSRVEGVERALGVARIVGIDDAGGFELAGLVDGVPYTLVVSSVDEDGIWKRVPEVDATLGWPGTRGVELRWNPRRVATLKIVDEATGAPVEDCLVMWRQGKAGNPDRGNQGFDYIREAQPDSPMRRRFDGGLVTLDMLPPGRTDLELSVRVIAVGYATKTAENLIVKTDASTDLGEVRLVSAPTVRVTVKVKETGATVAGAKVYLAKRDYQWLDWYAQSGSEVFGNTDVHYGVTGEDGIALLASMPGQRVRVTASTDKYMTPEPAEALLPPTGMHDVAVELTDGGTLIARVRRPNGAPASGVKVFCRKQPQGIQRGGTPSLEQVTDAEGVARFERLPKGLHEASVATEDQGNNGQRATWRAANVSVGEEVTVVLDSPSSGTLSGLILEAGQPLARVSVSLGVVGSDDGGGNEWSWGDDGSSARRATSRADGSYTLGPVAAGEWTITVRHGARAMASRHSVRILEGANTFDVRLDVALLEGCVLDESGAPVPHVDVQIMAKTENLQGGSQMIKLSESPTGDVNFDWNWQSLDRMQTTVEGRFSFRGIATARPLALSIRNQYIQPLDIELTDFADGELRDLGDLVAKGAGVVRVRRTASGRNAAGKVQLVRLPADDGTGAESVYATTNLRGGSNASFSSVPPGRYRAELVATDGTVSQRRDVEVVVREATTVMFE
jgi:hypothetical protein